MSILNNFCHLNISFTSTGAHNIGINSMFSGNIHKIMCVMMSLFDLHIIYMVEKFDISIDELPLKQLHGHKMCILDKG